MTGCRLCPRKCGVQRTDEQGGGFCGMPTRIHTAQVMLHMWEEPPISGERGSGAIFFSGCSLGCVFCQNHDISRGAVGKSCTAQELADVFRSLEKQGAHNINLVTGTHYIPQIIKAMNIYRPQLPVVWNCSGYETAEAIDMLAPYIDIWLPDYKYGLTETAAKYSRAPDYPETALAAIMRMRSLCPENIIEDGIMKKGVIIRHLILPSNIRNSVAALRRLASNLPSTPISLMSQYTPPAELGDNFSEINRPITQHEYDRVCSLADQLGITGYTQELTAADSAYVPKWDI